MHYSVTLSVTVENCCMLRKCYATVLCKLIARVTGVGISSCAELEMAVIVAS